MTTMRGQQHQELSPGKDPRVLYEQAQSKTLLFTTSISSNLRQYNGDTNANTGIYQCTLEPDNNFDDFNDGDESRETCHVASKLADRQNFYYERHHELELRNIQFDLSSLRAASNESKDKKNFLYANTHGQYRHDQREEPDWEIIRAELPKKGDFDSDVLGEEGVIEFESVFRTLEGINWNECHFDCCYQDDKIYDRMGSVPVETKQAFMQGVIRSFAVDEHTGDLFVSWEGFFKDCSYVFGSKRKLQWTIGVSRVKTEDSSCVFMGKEDETYILRNHFAKCTEPVSIVYQSTVARDVVMSYGGFSVIPASSAGEPQGGNGKRSFLLSVLQYSTNGDEAIVTSKVWSFPEGAKSFKDESKRQELGDGIVVDSVFMNQSVWDGGSLRLHYDSNTGKPDHLCRTVFEVGIECLPISIKLQDGMPVVKSNGESQMYLSKEQTAEFCRLGSAGKTPRKDWERRTTLVTGLDVQWDDLNGRPERIFFGCWGGEGGNGNFGSVQKNGTNLRKVMKGAHADAVLFLPQELEGTIDYRDPTPTDHPRPCVIEAREAKAASYSNNNDSNSKSLVAGLLMIVVALCLTIYKRRRVRGANSTQKEIRSQAQYVELRNFDDGSPEMIASPAPMEDTVNIVL